VTLVRSAVAGTFGADRGGQPAEVVEFLVGAQAG
jgi:hypothetical protein